MKEANNCVILLNATNAWSFSFLFPPVFAITGSNVTLPCRLNGGSDATPFASIGIRVKWSRIPEDETLDEEKVLLSLGHYTKTYGEFSDRAFLQQANEKDGSLVIMESTVSDSGRYRCEVFKGIEEVAYDVILQVEDGGLLNGTYLFNFTAQTISSHVVSWKDLGFMNQMITIWTFNNIFFKMVLGFVLDIYHLIKGYIQYVME